MATFDPCNLCGRGVPCGCPGPAAPTWANVDAVAAAHAALQKALEERDRVAAANAALEAELAEVLPYAGHVGQCRDEHGGRSDSYQTCTCGWTAMREKWRGK